MYDAFPDPYVYAGTSVLKNRRNIRDAVALEQFEAASSMQRGSEPLPRGRFDAGHYRAVHRHLFGDVYRWAGRYRVVRIAKGDSVFCYPENIPKQMDVLFTQLNAQSLLTGLSRRAFAGACAAFLATLNHIHPFRDGNGRSQIAFVAALAARAGHPLSIGRMEGSTFLAAIIQSFAGEEDALAAEILKLSV